MIPETVVKWSARLGKVGRALVLLLGLATLVWFHHQQYPAQHWMFWHYASYWVGGGVFSLAMVSTGYAALRRLRTAPHRPAETLVLSFSLGVGVYYLLINALGHLHLFNRATFFILPAAMVLVGARPLYAFSRRLWRRARFGQPGGAFTQRLAPLQLVGLLFGVGAICLIYFKILTPENVQFDARWKHLALAEQYVHVGFIPRFAEGWTVATNPHLATMVYTWGFMAPYELLFDHVELSTHLEFVFFLWQVAAIGPAVRRLLPREHHVRGVWVARFLFPGIFLYDSSLAGGADHIAATFGLPVLLALFAVRRHFHWKNAAVLAAVLAAGAMGKLTAALMMAPGVVLSFVALAGSDLRRHRHVKTTALVLLAGLGGGLLVSSPFWLRNWIWHGDPMYPSLHNYLTLRPWTDESANIFVHGYKKYQFWRPPRDLTGVKRTARALFDFSFIPNDYGRYHGRIPVFGSLFTILTLCLPSFRRVRRVWWLTLMTLTGLAIWYWVHHQDRYLQVLVPWMTAATAAMMVRLWRDGWLTKVALGALVSAQVVLTADAYYYPAHAFIKRPVVRVMDTIAMGFKKKYAQRFDVFGRWRRVGKTLPQDAFVMLHDNHNHLGLSRRTASDWNGWQYGISYGRLTSAAKIYDLYRDFGISHVIYTDLSNGWDNVAGDLVFYDFAKYHTEGARSAGSLRIVRMPKERPADTPYGKVLLLFCGGNYPNGLYKFSDLMTPTFGPNANKYAAPVEKATVENAEALSEKAAFVGIDPRCQKKVTWINKSFVHLVKRRRLAVRSQPRLNLYTRAKKGEKHPH